MTRDNWVRSLGLDADGSLFVEIDNGIRLYDSCLQHTLPGEIAIAPEDLMKPENRQKLENNANDVHYETDFRSVYAAVLDKWLGTDSVRILGADFRAPGLQVI